VPQGRPAPDAVVIVATVRAMKMNGGVAKADLGAENVEAVKKGCANLGRHIENVKSSACRWSWRSTISSPTPMPRSQAVKAFVAEQGAEAILCKHWAEGSAGHRGSGHKVVELPKAGEAHFAPLYPDEMPLFEKIETDRQVDLPRRAR
jgi:formate--tetrahydrofolate ligase